MGRRRDHDAAVDWASTYLALAPAAPDDLDTDDLDRLAVAAYLTGREEEAFALWEHGHRRCGASGEVVRAARFGVQLAQALAFKGDLARTGGWVARVRHLLDEADVDCVEQGFVESLTAFCRIIEAGDVAGARAGFERAGKIGHRFQDVELVTVARLGEGRCLVYSGEVDDGLSLLDEVMISVEAGEVSPVAVGDAYCTVIDACHELFDLHRCETWTASFTQWCDAHPDVVLYRGQCLLHRADLLLLRGRWDEALVVAEEACARLADPVNLFTIGAAHYLAGEVHRLRGELDEAEVAFSRASDLGGQPQPGMALLRVAQGRPGAASAAIRRALGEAEDPISRAALLEPAVEILVADGDVEAAHELAAELGEIATVLSSPLLAAYAAHAAGATLLAAGDPSAALGRLRRAWSGWCDLDVPYAGARTRLLLADGCAAVGDADGEVLERRAADATLLTLGAPHSGEAPGTTAGADAGLSARETEVLLLVAQGLANREIAAELFISEKTVASHLNHIFTKADVTSRAAATAFAYEQGIITRG